MKKLHDLASRMRERIIVEQPIEASDNAGGMQISWQAYATIWAEIIPIRQREELFAGQLAKLTTHKITVRFFPEINSKMRINFNGRIFKIISVLNIEERSEILEILAEEGVAR